MAGTAGSALVTASCHRQTEHGRNSRQCIGYSIDRQIEVKNASLDKYGLDRY